MKILKDRFIHFIIYFAIMELIGLFIHSKHLEFLVLAFLIATYHDIFEPIINKIFKK